MARARAADAGLFHGPSLVLAPHPDDETLGCGGLIRLASRQGAAVRVLIATDGASSHASEQTRATTREALVALRRRETVAACRALGLQDDAVRFLDLPDGGLDRCGARLEAGISEALASMRVARVFVCAAVDGHPDHRALNAAVRRLQARGALAAEVYEYPVWAFDFRSWRPVGRTNKAAFALGLGAMLGYARRARVLRLDIREALPDKRRALAAHRSQVGPYDEEPEWSALPADFLGRFLMREELFFPLPPAGPGR